MKIDMQCDLGDSYADSVSMRQHHSGSEESEATCCSRLPHLGQPGPKTLTSVLGVAMTTPGSSADKTWDRNKIAKNLGMTLNDLSEAMKQDDIWCKLPEELRMLILELDKDDSKQPMIYDIKEENMKQLKQWLVVAKSLIETKSKVDMKDKQHLEDMKVLEESIEES